MLVVKTRQRPRRYAHQRHTLHTRRGLHLTWSLLALLPLLGCGVAPLYHGPPPPTPIAVAPASLLGIHFRLEAHDQSPGVPAGDGVLFVQILLNGQPTFLTRDHTLVCDGQDVMAANPFVPDHPSGGAHTCIYTDEQGHQTTLRIVPPAGDFHILSPGSGAAVTIPRPPSGAATPIPVLSPVPTPTLAPGEIPSPLHPQRPAGYVSQPPVLVRYTTLTPPPEAAAPSATAWGSVRGPFTPQSVALADVEVPEQRMTGTLPVSDLYTIPGQGFEAFAPGPGKLLLAGHLVWSLQGTGFHDVQVEFNYSQTEPLTWVG